MTSTKPQRRLSMRGLIEIHKQLLARYGGQSREVDLVKLELALQRAVSFAADNKWSMRARLGAGYGWSLLKGRPFAEGNERVALAAMVVLLEMYDLEWKCGEVEETAMVKDAAAKRIDEGQWIEWVVRNTVGKKTASVEA
jgi:prophage maintenance system killer protein